MSQKIPKCHALDHICISQGSKCTGVQLVHGGGSTRDFAGKFTSVSETLMEMVMLSIAGDVVSVR